MHYITRERNVKERSKDYICTIPNKPEFINAIKASLPKGQKLRLHGRGPRKSLPKNKNMRGQNRNVLDYPLSMNPPYVACYRKLCKGVMTNWGITYLPSIANSNLK
jgi:hypothetical protein